MEQPQDLHNITIDQYSIYILELIISISNMIQIYKYILSYLNLIELYTYSCMTHESRVTSHDYSLLSLITIDMKRAQLQRRIFISHIASTNGSSSVPGSLPDAALRASPVGPARSDVRSTTPSSENRT